MKKLRFAAIPAFGLALWFCVTLIFSPPLSAQTTYASIAGVVTDSSGAAITSAQGTLTNLDTGEKRTEPTGVDGLYSFVNVLPGRYRIEVEKTGFKRTTRPEVIVEVGQSVRIDLTMQVGDMTQTVEVTGETPLLQSETSSLGQVVEERKANELPLNGRNVFNLISLAPAVVPQGSATGTPVGVNPFGWGNYQVNGSFGNESAEYLDGQPLNIGYINLPVIIPVQDSIQEFKVQTSNLGADWGKFSGGPVLIPHYDGREKTFWFVSWEGFRLRIGTPFTTTVPTPAERAGDFSAIPTPVKDPCGGTVSTPIACPGFTGAATTFPGNVIPSNRQNPTSLALLKFFPLPNSAGAVDPKTGILTNNFTTATSGGGNQNQVVGRFDQNLGTNQHLFFRFSYWNVNDLPIDPLGTGLCADRCSELYYSYLGAIGYSYSVTNNTIIGINFSASRFRYNRAPINAGFDLTTIGWPAQYNTVVPSAARTPPTPCVFNFADNIMCTQGQSFIQDRNTQFYFSPSVTLVRGRHTAKFGIQLEIGRDNYAQTNVASGSFAFCGSGLPCFSGFSFADFLLGFADNPSSVENHFFGQAVVPAFVAGQQIYRAFYVDDTYRVTNKLTLNLGLRYDLQGPWSERFNRQSFFDSTAQSWLSNPATTAGLAGLPGLPGTKGDVFLVSPSGKRTNIPLDRTEVSPRIGFAYSLNPKTVVRSGYGIFWIPNYVSFGLNPNNDPVNDATTSFIGTVNGNVPTNTINTPFLPTIVPPVGRSLGTLGTQMYATQTVQSFAIAGDGLTNHPAGYVQQWNLNIQRELPSHFFVSAAYVGSKGTHLPLYDSEIDQLGDNFFAQAATQCAAQVAVTGTRCVGTVPTGVPTVTALTPVPNPFFDSATGTAFALGSPTTTLGQLSRPFPQYSSLRLAGQGNFDSSYNSFQLTVERRFPSGGSLLVAYTNAKLISDADTLTNWLEVATGSIQDHTNLKGERSLSSQDVSQRLVISYVLDLPFGHGKRFLSSVSGVKEKIVGGWGIDGVTTFQKGFPLVFGNGAPNYTTLFGAGSRPNFVAGCNKGTSAGSKAAKLNQWFNTGCFTAPADFTFGNEARVDPSIRGSAINNFDFALFKRTRFGPDERLGFEFRAEFFNIFNRTQFAPPNTSVTSSTFGVVSSTYPGTNPRLIQFGLKIFF